jgi:hypothetical protein
MKVMLIALFAAFTLGACAGVSLPPKAGPEEVAVINPAMGQAADEGFKVIGPVTVRAPIGTSTEDMIQMLRTEAAELGADAIILEGISAPQDLSAVTDTEEGLIGRARAIYWPAETEAN